MTTVASVSGKILVSNLERSPYNVVLVDHLESRLNMLAGGVRSPRHNPVSFSQPGQAADYLQQHASGTALVLARNDLPDGNAY
ncbi:hypothetical protein J4475_03350, partial [Candidatus Woesearchaeota archaeon]|nr:hypothetical protein [Candidatus Woesearchaeota archaeon]